MLAQGDDVCVATGPLFDFNRIGTIRGGVLILVFIYKAVFDPTAGIAGVYVARNAPGWECWPLKLAEFRLTLGARPISRRERNDRKHISSFIAASA